MRRGMHIKRPNEHLSKNIISAGIAPGEEVPAVTGSIEQDVSATVRSVEEDILATVSSVKDIEETLQRFKPTSST